MIPRGSVDCYASANSSISRIESYQIRDSVFVVQSGHSLLSIFQSARCEIQPLPWRFSIRPCGTGPPGQAVSNGSAATENLLRFISSIGTTSTVVVIRPSTPSSLQEE